MTDFGDRLARVLHDAVPEPPHELEPERNPGQRRQARAPEAVCSRPRSPRWP